MRAIQGIAATGLMALALLVSPSGSNRVATFHLTPGATAAPTPGRLSPGGAAELRAILRSARLTELRWPDFSNYKASVAEIYADTGDQLIWVEGSRPTPEALGVIRVLENADEKGLVPADYDGPRWAGRLAELEPPRMPPESEAVRFDVALTVSAMRYLYDLHLGRVDLRNFHTGFDVERSQYDLARFLLERIARASNIQPALAEIEPPFPSYRRTLRALAKYRQLAREYKGKPLPVPKKTVDPGASYRAAPQLAQLLRLLGDLPPTAPIPSGDVYGEELVGAVRHFQLRHGLEPDGRIGRQTFAALNTPLTHRVLQLELTLERWRWLPHQFDQPPIIVNIPEFHLYAIDAEHRQALAMKVVLGRAYGYKTPVFAAEMDAVVFRPYWKVPYSIQRDELVPDIRKNPDYLIENRYEVVDARGRVVSEGEADARILRGLRAGTLYARQKPGPMNSLGLIKFDMPNPYDIYMHGTPATALFSRSRRDFSHGCIRVEDPAALAQWALRENPGWTKERIRKAMNGDKTFREKLAEPVPVLIVYGTAVVAEDGEAYFFRDIYGLDADLEKALAAGRPYPLPPGRTSKGSSR